MPVNRTPDEQNSGSTMNTALVDDEQKRIQRQQELGEEASAGTSSGSSTIGGSSATQTSAPVKAMPKQQKAGTGSFANLKTYLQAAQGGGQQKVAQAATQQVQRLGAGAQKDVQQAQESFGRQMQAGSGAVFQGEQGQALSQEEASSRAQQRAQEAINAARAVTYQAPQVTTQAEGEAPAQTPVPAQPQQYFTPEQQQRFAEIINAQYQGPASLQQAGLYEQAARKARAAQQAGELTQTAGGREQLLRDVFGRGRDYSRGASRLDALLLNASEQGVQQLQQQAQPALQSQQALQAAQNLSANEAAQRAAAIQGISSGARQQFTEARAAEEQAAQDYITNIQENWNKLPEYFKETLSSARTPSGQLALSSEEAALLGLRGGQSLFGITPESLQAAQMATGAELITKDQLSRQLALAQLAGLDKLGGLKKDLMYSDLEKAGTKDLLSSLDVGTLQRDLAEREKAAIDRLGLINSRIGNRVVNTPYGMRDSDVLQLLGKTYNLKDLIQTQGGYQAIDSEKQAQAASDFLRTLVENPEAVANVEATPNLIEAIKSNLGYDPRAKIKWTDYSKNAIDTSSIGRTSAKDAQNLVAKNWQSAFINPLTRAGFTRDVAISDNEATKARAAALRNLLSGLNIK